MAGGFALIRRTTIWIKGQRAETEKFLRFVETSEKAEAYKRGYPQGRGEEVCVVPLNADGTPLTRGGALESRVIWRA